MSEAFRATRPFLLSRRDAEGELKYVVLLDDEDGGPGEIRLVDPLSGASHSQAVDVHERVLSAGRVIVDRAARTVVMGDRDSFSLCVPSLPGSEDAELVRSWLFDHLPARKGA